MEFLLALIALWGAAQDPTDGHMCTLVSTNCPESGAAARSDDGADAGR
jgi:hypothetical protein